MQLFGLSIWTALLVVFSLYVLSVYVQRYVSERRIRSLGGIAPIVKCYAPFGLDFCVKAVRGFLSGRAMEQWVGLFTGTNTDADGTGSYTAELRLLANERIIFTADPDNIKAVLTTQFADYGKGAQFHAEWKDFLGDSIFTTDGQKWHDARQLIRPLFMRERVADLDVIEQHVQKIIKHLGPGDGRMVDLNNLLYRFALDSSTHFLFGHSPDSLDNEQSEFALAFDEVQRVQALAGRAGPLRHFFPMKSFYAGLHTMEQFIEPWINEALSLSPAELESKTAKSETFIHALARFTRDRKVMRDQLVALLLAGRDTTSTAMSWLFLELARNPHVVKKLQVEIARNIGIKGQQPDYQNIKDMKYLTHIINETLRLYPVVPFNVRTALADTTLPHGAGADGTSPLGILKGTAIGYSPLVMHRRHDLYPAVSEKFPYPPEKWVPERWETWQPKSWHWIPFNGGPRICIGQQFAMVEMAYVVIRILQQYDRIVDYGNEGGMQISIVLNVAGGVKVGFIRDEST